MDATSFLGRDAETAEVHAALAGGWRLVTLVGPPGIGKTRVARRVAQSASAPLFIDLADVRCVDELVMAVGAELGISLVAETAKTAARAVGAGLARWPAGTLIILDQLEQIAGAGEVMTSWLEQAPTVAFVVCAHTRLQVLGERAVEVGPLSLSSAMALLEERLRGPLGRPLLDGERAHAEAIVRALGCVPLAIELAAGQGASACPPSAPAMSGDGLARLARDVAGLAEADVARVAEKTVAWVWEQLPQEERCVLAQLSILRRGFLMEQAEGVLDLAAADAQEVMRSLCERSLLWARRDPFGTLRFGACPTVQPLARAGLAASDVALVKARHARTFERCAARCAARVRSDGPAALAALLADADNIIAAFTHCTDDEPLASLALSLATVFRRRGTRSLHEAALQRGIAAAQAAGRPDLEGDLLQARAALASAAGEVELARSCQEQALALATAHDDARRASFARARRGWDRFELGDSELGLADMRAAADQASQAGDLEPEAYACDRLGLALILCGSTTAGIEELTRAATLALRSHDRWLRQKVLGELVWCHRRLGAIESAAQRLLELGAQGDPLDGAIEAATALEHAALARATGRLDDALRLLGEAIPRADDHGALRVRAMLRVERGAVLLDAGRAADAVAALEDALVLAERIQSPRFRVEALVELARARQDAGELDAALSALDHAEESLGRCKDAVLSVAIATLRAMVLGARQDSRARAAAEQALTIAQRVGGKPLVMASAVVGLLDPSRLDDRRSAVEALAARLTDVESRAAVALLRGQSTGIGDDTAQTRALRKIQSGRCHREMVVGADGRFYELDGQRISLQRQRSLRLILLALVEQAEQAPGVGLPQCEVVARGWPGEKMRPDSGATRVYTSIRRLRRTGLAGVLLTRDDGYLLDPSVVVKRA